MRSLSITRGIVALWVVGAVLGTASWAQAQLVPGTGNLLNYDDLEDANWGYVHNFPKSSKEEDENIRYPLGGSTNRMWSESPKRGSPDVVKRCETPAGGLPGSTGALYLRTRDSGIPGHPMNKQCQDDFILMARPCGVGYSPNYVVRVYLPEFQEWEQRQGVSFGIRAGMQGPMTKEKELSLGKRFLRGGKRTEKVTETEPYYPGFFIAFNPLSATNKEPYAQILIRSDHMGNEVGGPKITQTGWWTFGMSVTPDARCHYYAHAGIADLTAKDHIYSSLPYNIRGEMFNTIFFNVCSADNGATWSTPWIIDDPKVYYSGPAIFKPQTPQAPQQAQQPQPQQTVDASSGTPNAQNATMTREIPATPAAPAAATAAPAQAQPATPANPPAQQTASPAPVIPATSAKPAAVKVPVVGIPALPSVADHVALAPAPGSDIEVHSPALVPIAAPSAAALQQPPAVSTTPAGPVRPIALSGVPVRAPSLVSISKAPTEASGPSSAMPSRIVVQTIAPVPAAVEAPSTFSPPATMVPVAAPKIPAVKTVTSTPARTPGVPVRSASISTPVSVEKPQPVEKPVAMERPVISKAPATTPALTPVSKPIEAAPLAAPEVEAASAPSVPAAVNTMSSIPLPEPEETSALTEDASPGSGSGSPALMVPSLSNDALPREELVPARNFQRDNSAPLTIPTLPSVDVQSAAVPVPALPASAAANPFDDVKKAGVPAVASPSTAAEEPPLTILTPAVDTTKADPSPVPVPPAIE